MSDDGTNTAIQITLQATEVKRRLARVLRSELSELDAASRRRLTSALFAELLREEVEESPVHLVEAISGLPLPPAPRRKYADATGVAADRFLREVWSDYLDAGLLTLGYLIAVDKSLYYALRKAAKNDNQTFRSFAASLGVLTPERLRLPTADQKRQAAAIRHASTIARRSRWDGPQ